MAIWGSRLLSHPCLTLDSESLHNFYTGASTQVTLLIPWLNQDDQALVFHGKYSFQQPEQQTECIKEWIRKRTGFNAQFKIRYYPGRYDTRLLGIFPVGDLTVYIPVEEVSCQSCNTALSPPPLCLMM